MSDATKFCPLCRQEKALSEFGTRKLKSGERRPTYCCTKCQSAASLAHYHGRLKHDPVEKARRAAYAKARKDSREKRQLLRRREAERAGRTYQTAEARTAAWAERRSERQRQRSERIAEAERVRLESVRRLTEERAARPELSYHAAAIESRRAYAQKLEYRLYINIKRRIRRTTGRSLSALAIHYGVAKAAERSLLETLLGYHLSALVAHIEFGFRDGMSWDGYRQGLIHLDHCVPLVAFEPMDTLRDFRRAWSLMNLRPLWAEENARKSVRDRAHAVRLKAHRFPKAPGSYGFPRVIGTADPDRPSKGS